MRTALLRPAVVLLSSMSFMTLTACAGRARSASSAAVTPSVNGGDAEDVALLAAEDRRYHDRADALRAQILHASGWTEFDQDNCNPGSLRTFTRDTSAAGVAQVEGDVEQLERVIIARGVDNSLDTPVGHDLLSTVIRWESASDRPLWDVLTGKPDRHAIATGLSGEFFNPQTKKCESYVPYDTVTIVIPPVPGYVMPKMKGVRATLYVGEEGLKKGRDQFYETKVAQGEQIFSYTRIRTAVLWRDYAVVAVNRPAEVQGVMELRQGAGGASYIFHRVGDQWRLLVIARTWG